jgi:hypothetical protein
MRNTTRRTAALLVVAITCGCASADAAKRTSASYAVDQLPQPVVAAAGNAVKGIEITDAKRRVKRKEVVYNLRGFTADGKEYELKVSEIGKVLDVEEESAKKKDAQAQASIPSDSPFRQIGAIQHPSIRESSGIVASRRHPGVLWTHNDKGNAPELYAIGDDGKLLARYAIAGAVNNDWEDIDADDDGRLYVGRIGNNDARNVPIEVLRVAEPETVESSNARRTLEVDRAWRLRYPAKPFDCESLFIHGAHGYLISKHLDGAPAALYRFDLQGAQEQTLTKLADLPIRHPVTGANLSPNGTQLAVLTYGTLYRFDLAGRDPAHVGQVELVKVATPTGKLEGVCFTPQGILVTSEGRQIYLLGQTQSSTASTIAPSAR